MKTQQWVVRRGQERGRGRYYMDGDGDWSNRQEDAFRFESELVAGYWARKSNGRVVKLVSKRA